MRGSKSSLAHTPLMVWCLTEHRENSTLTSTLESIQLMSIKYGMNVFQKKEYFLQIQH